MMVNAARYFSEIHLDVAFEFYTRVSDGSSILNPLLRERQIVFCLKKHLS